MIPSPKAQIQNGGLIFDSDDDFKAAIDSGYFYLPIPHYIDIEIIKKLSTNFYKGVNSEFEKDYKKLEIYYDRKDYQIENLLVADDDWSVFLTTDVQKELNSIANLTNVVFSKVLNMLKVNSEIWEAATAGTSEKDCVYFFASSHYRHFKDAQGCPSHKDTGFITILYLEDGGLEYLFGDKWLPIKPVKDCFVVHFGKSFEVLTAKYDVKVMAIEHKVRQVKNDRFSFAVFLHPLANKTLCSLTSRNSFEESVTVKTLIHDFNKKVWSNEHPDFGLTEK